jgi:hypothetical protein
MKILAIIVGVGILSMAVVAGAIVDPPRDDHSDPNLVRAYLGMPCDGLDEIYTFLYDGMVHTFNHYKSCLERAESDSDFKYGHLKCYYMKMEWDLLDKHASSIEKAWNLMCDDSGVRKNPEYEIDF